jgi:gliding motility-associated-like protein
LLISSSRTAVSLTITSQAAPTGSPLQTFCESENATIANLTITGTNVKWYSSLTSTTALASSQVLTDGDYYATQTSTTTSSCESVNRLKITVRIDRPQPPIIGNATQPTCSNTKGSVQLSGLPGTGTWTIIPSTGNSISGLGTTFEFSNLAPSTSYTFKVTNGNGCTSVLSSLPITINAIPNAPNIPTTSSVVQPTCALPSGTIVIAQHNGVEYSINGTNFQTGSTFSSLVSGSYKLYVRNLGDTSCVTSSATAVVINAIPTAPNIPTTSSVVQPTCALQSGTIVIAQQNGVEYSINGTNFQSSSSFSGLTSGSYTLYVRNLGDPTCLASSSTATAINSVPNAPIVPTVENLIQPTCSIPSGTIEIVAQSGAEYSIGNGFQDNPEFNNLQPGDYTISVRFKNNTSCVASGIQPARINAIPEAIQFQINGDCENKEFVLTASPINDSYDVNNVSYEWKNSQGVTIGTNSEILNLSKIIANSPNKDEFPADYTLTVTSLEKGCETTNTINIQSIYCDIQKGISPDSNTSNNTFDLSFLKVKKLEIYNRYGLQVYSKVNYTKEWEGQTNNGDLLPSATYYYVIEFTNGEKPKTGWIYLIRENNK